MKQVLYRFYDDQDRLLYVGITNTWYQRFHAHEKSAGWFSEVSYVIFERYATRDEVVAAETLAIQTENPIFNKALNPDYETSVIHFQQFKNVAFKGYGADAFHQPVVDLMLLQLEDFQLPRKNAKWAAFIFFGAYNNAVKAGFECRNCEAIFATSQYRVLANQARDEYNATN